jgi:hypothetical protein
MIGIKAQKECPGNHKKWHSSTNRYVEMHFLGKCLEIVCDAGGGS